MQHIKLHFITEACKVYSGEL